jgi:cbb3-type cytochrome oxidase maturation protein
VSVLVLLVFASLAIAATFLAAFVWAVRSGQYEDTCTPSMRVLVEEPGKTAAPQPRDTPGSRQNNFQSTPGNDRVVASTSSDVNSPV